MCAREAHFSFEFSFFWMQSPVRGIIFQFNFPFLYFSACVTKTGRRLHFFQLLFFLYNATCAPASVLKACLAHYQIHVQCLLKELHSRIERKKRLAGAPEIKNTKFATTTQYRVFLYFFFFSCTKCAISTQQVRKMGFSGAPNLLFFFFSFFKAD